MASSASAESPSWALAAAFLAAVAGRASRDQAEAYSCLHHSQQNPFTLCRRYHPYTTIMNACTCGATVVALLKSGRPKELEKTRWEGGHPLGWEAAWGRGCGVGGRQMAPCLAGPCPAALCPTSAPVCLLSVMVERLELQSLLFWHLLQQQHPYAACQRLGLGLERGLPLLWAADLHPLQSTPQTKNHCCVKRKSNTVRGVLMLKAPHKWLSISSMSDVDESSSL